MMQVARAAGLVLPRTRGTRVRHRLRLALIGSATGALQVDGRTRVFAEEESSLRRRGL